MHQRLVDVRYYIEHSQRPPLSPAPCSPISQEAPPTVKPISQEAPPTVWPISQEAPPPVKKTAKVQRELEKHELKQIKVKLYTYSIQLSL